MFTEKEKQVLIETIDGEIMNCKFEILGDEEKNLIRKLVNETYIQILSNCRDKIENSKCTNT